MQQKTLFQLKNLFFILFLLAAIFYVHHVAPFPQDPNYNSFADARTYFGIPNFFNVVSNFGFFWFGVLGIYSLFAQQKDKPCFIDSRERYFYLIFFTGVFFVGFGSSYYHWLPNNATLVWDRLPMTVAFMAFFTAILAERISLRFALYIFVPLLLIGASSVYYWHFTEALGVGDLRPYLFVQGFTVAAIPILLLLFPAKYTASFYIMLTFLFYVLAKLCETYDVVIYRATHQIVSGHVIKHLTAALAVYFIYVYLKRRELLQK